MTSDTHYRICSICEAACGLKVTADRRTITRIEANPDDVFSQGHICAKGIALKELDQDPDRLRSALVKTASGFSEVSHQSAYGRINDQLNRVISDYGPASVAMYIGNPTAHNIGLSRGLGVLATCLGSPQIYSAASVDQIPKQLASKLMFGNDMAIAVPDIERTDHLLMLGANPAVSNGSLWMVPKFRERLRHMKKRGGTFTVIDPRRSETARLADDHYFIRPAGDAWLLIGVLNHLLGDGVKFPGYYPLVNQEMLQTLAGSISFVEVERHCGISETDVRKIAQDLVDANSSAVYGRIGTTLQSFGSLTSFLIECVNILTGNLDQPGGAMFPEQPIYSPRPSGAPGYHRYQTRASGHQEVLGQFPVVALAEEIETPGEGQVKALICIAGNPLVSNPSSDRLRAAIDSLDFMVCIDIYHNETTRLADVILPGTSPFEDSHYDSFLGAMGYRNTARYSPAVFEPDHDNEWRTCLTMTHIIAEKSVPNDAEVTALEDSLLAAEVRELSQATDSPLYECDEQEILSLIEPSVGVERFLDLLVRTGKWGDHFCGGDGLTLAKMRGNGVDLGELGADRLVELMSIDNIDLAPPLIVNEFSRLRSQSTDDEFLLIGRRGVSSNNSWLRNLPMLSQGKHPCYMEIHPIDAEKLDIADGGRALVSANNQQITVNVEISENVSPGVCSFPHGYSEEVLMQHASLKGANYNRLANLTDIDVPTGTAALNGIAIVINKA